MIKNGGGKIVNVGARAAIAGVASMGAYTATKSAVIESPRRWRENLLMKISM